ncbi:DUF6893 family small protein [Streptomyces sp. NPDC002004]
MKKLVMCGAAAALLAAFAHSLPDIRRYLRIRRM